MKQRRKVEVVFSERVAAINLSIHFCPTEGAFVHFSDQSGLWPFLLFNYYTFCAFFRNCFKTCFNITDTILLRIGFLKQIEIRECELHLQILIKIIFKSWGK